MIVLGRWAVMAGMMSGADMGAWLFVWVLLGLFVAAGGGILAARALGRRGPGRRAIDASESVALRQARDALRMRYASGEIGREEYLQGKVELED